MNNVAIERKQSSRTMEVKQKPFAIKKLVSTFDSGQLVRNSEYQRGEAWSEVQKAAFVDSVFRSYPVPALFLHRVETIGLDDAPSSRHEIVDGQQRLTALRDFWKGIYPTQPVSEKSKLRLPAGVRNLPAPWAGKYFTDLPHDLQEQFLITTITVFEIASDTDSDEIRDLFIRLQSGTALSRQQIRDAWPGNLGPFIESLAGKLKRRPSHPLFGIVDKRGHKGDEDTQRDPYVMDRQTCAQLLAIFIARANDPYAFPGVSARQLDSLYHEYTDFDATSVLAERFRAVLDHTANVFARASKSNLSKKKYRRLDVTAIMMHIQDVTRSDNTKLSNESIAALAKTLVQSDEHEKPIGKGTSGTTLQKYYEWWRSLGDQDVAIRLDPKRAFDEMQKQQIKERQQCKCAVCGDDVLEDEAEYDHFPQPHRDGGHTVIENGRLVHKSCHERGRPPQDA